MDAIGIAMTSAALLAAGWLLVKQYPFGAKRRWRDPFEGFDEVARGVEQTNMAYFRSLELMLKNIESVRARTEQAEQRFWGIVARPGIERQDRYQAAELLLAQGQKPSKVASMLNLPLSQVKNLRDPQKFSDPEQIITAKNMMNRHARLAPKKRPEPSTRRTKKAPRTAPHPEAIVDGGSELFPAENRRPRFNGTVEQNAARGS